MTDLDNLLKISTRSAYSTCLDSKVHDYYKEVFDIIHGQKSAEYSEQLEIEMKYAGVSYGIGTVKGFMCSVKKEKGQKTVKDIAEITSQFYIQPVSKEKECLVNTNSTGLSRSDDLEKGSRAEKRCENNELQENRALDIEIVEKIPDSSDNSDDASDGSFDSEEWADFFDDVPGEPKEHEETDERSMDCEEIDSEKKSGSGSDYDDDDAMNGDEDNEVDEARQTFAFVNVETRFRNRTAENVLAELLAQCKISGPAIIVSVDRLPIKGGANNKHMITFKLDDVEYVTIS